MKVISSLLFAFLVFYPFGQLTRLPLNLIGDNLVSQFPEINLYLTDVILGLLLVTWVIWRVLMAKKKYQLPPLARPMFLFLFVALLSLIFNSPLFSSREIVVAGLYLLRLTVYFGLYFLVYDLKKSKQMLNFLTVIGVAMAIFGLVQYFLWPDLSALYYLGWDPHYYRVIGTFFDPGFTGIIYVLTLILLVVLNWQKLTQLKVKYIGFYCLLLVVYSALALTYSRSSYLAYFMSMGIIGLMKKKLKFFLIISLVMVLTILILPRGPGGEGVRLERTTTIQSRFGSWQQALAIFRHQPILGVGFNAYRYAQRDYSFLTQEGWQVSHAGAGADSSLLFVLATTGLAGLLVYFWFWGSVVRLTFKTANAKVGLVVLASAIGLFCHSFFLNSLFYPWVLAWLGIILGLL